MSGGPRNGDAGAAFGSLDGVRVVDLSHMLSGPYCTMLLSDHGADVVKVEPIAGDGARRFGPFPPGGPNRWGFGGYFQSVNRGKRSVAVDLKQPEGREVVRRLAASADVLIENFRPGVMDRLGLSYEALREENPGLVYAAIRGFGDPRTGLGTRGDLPAFDLNAQALGGFMSITGAEGEPMKAGPGIGDIFPAVLCSFGIVSALRHRDRTGEGQYLDVAMYDALVALCERIVYQHSYTGLVPQGQGNEHPLLSVYGVFPTLDGLVTIAAPADDLSARLFRQIGRPEMAADERFATVGARLHNARELRGIIEDWTSTRTTDEVVGSLAGVVAVGAVQDAAAIVADPHLHARDMTVPLEHPNHPEPVTVAGVPVKMTRTPGAVRDRAPLLGEHVEAILGELGYDASRVADLARRGVVGEPPPAPAGGGAAGGAPTVPDAAGAPAGGSAPRAAEATDGTAFGAADGAPVTGASVPPTRA
jgi:crotonobetainyl-CoA:carnitine CoA-transferase CaiB-like acyl-CoA transferase